MALYPGTIPSFTSKVDQVDINFADHINRLQDELAAVTVELGVLPKGSSADVRTRLEGLQTGKADSVHSHSQQYIARALVTSKGQLLVGTGSESVTPVSAPSNNQALISDDTQTAGMKFASLTHSMFSDLSADNYSQYALADGSRGAFLPTAGGTMTGSVLLDGYREKVVDRGVVTGSVTFDAADGSTFIVTIGGNLTVALEDVANGESTPLTILFTQDGVGDREWTWPSSVTWLGSGPPAPTGPGTKALVSLVSFDGTSWVGVALNEF